MTFHVKCNPQEHLRKKVAPSKHGKSWRPDGCYSPGGLSNGPAPYEAQLVITDDAFALPRGSLFFETDSYLLLEEQDTSSGFSPTLTPPQGNLSVVLPPTLLLDLLGGGDIPHPLPLSHPLEEKNPTPKPPQNSAEVRFGLAS